MIISVWTNPTAIFILIGAWTTEQSQVKHELLFCARVLLGNIRRISLFKNLGYWNAYFNFKTPQQKIIHPYTRYTIVKVQKLSVLGVHQYLFIYNAF